MKVGALSNKTAKCNKQADHLQGCSNEAMHRDNKNPSKVNEISRSLFFQATIQCNYLNSNLASRHAAARSHCCMSGKGIKDFLHVL
jgi:hypothetical protein